MLHPKCSTILLHAFVITALVFVFSSCAKKPVMTAGQGAEQNAAISSDEYKQSSKAQSKAETKKKAAAKKAKKIDPSLCTEYVVKKGDCLWWIAKYKDVYNDPFMWQIIYDNNKDKIKNPNRIYPGQKLLIPKKGYKLDEIKMIRKKAGAKKPYTPPQAAKLPIN